NLDAEDRVLNLFDVIKFAGEGGVHHRASVRQVHAFAYAVGATGPASVDEPAANPVLLDLLAEQIGIDVRVVHHERRAKASREVWLGLGNSILGTSDLSCVTG